MFICVSRNDREAFPMLTFVSNGVYFDNRFANNVYYWLKVFVVSEYVGFMEFIVEDLIEACAI